MLLRENDGATCRLNAEHRVVEHAAGRHAIERLGERRIRAVEVRLAEVNTWIARQTRRDVHQASGRTAAPLNVRVVEVGRRFRIASKQSLWV